MADESPCRLRKENWRRRKWRSPACASPAASGMGQQCFRDLSEPDFHNHCFDPDSMGRLLRETCLAKVLYSKIPTPDTEVPGVGRSPSGTEGTKPDRDVF
ncbi:MAG: hypothetical protein ACT6RN_08700 [Agrobacterium sp.]